MREVLRFALLSGARGARGEDDGSGGDWEQSTGLSKKAEKRKEKQDMIKKQEVRGAFSSSLFSVRQKVNSCWVLRGLVVCEQETL